MYIKKEDYDYIMNKYHDQSKPFEPLSRLNYRNDDIFDSDSGLSYKEIVDGVFENDELYKDLPHEIRKAKGFDYILKNTRISCDKRDIFPNLNATTRPLYNTLLIKWHREVFVDIIPEVYQKMLKLRETGVAGIYPDYDHSVPTWERLFELGYIGIIKDVEQIRKDKPRTDKENAFYDGIILSYQAIIDFLIRLRDRAINVDNNVKMADSLNRIIEGPPQTFYDCLLFSYIYFMVNEHVDFVQVRSLSNFDRIYYKYYINDLKNGITEEEIRKDLAYFFLQFTAIGNYWNQPVYLGGENSDGSTVINELSYLFLDVYDKLNIYSPKIQIKFSNSTPKDFVFKALDMIRRGHNSIAFVCDYTIREHLIKRGYTPEQARLAVIKGCYEYSVHDSFGTGMNSINLLKPLEFALHNGNDAVSGLFSGNASPNLDSYKTFDDLFNEYLRQLNFIIDETIKTVNSFEKYLSYVNPQLLISGTFKTSLEKAKDPLCGGATGNGSSINFGFIADICDSFTMIKKYVYDRKEITLKDFVEILDNDFKGNEKFRLKLLNDKEKYGNNKDFPDSIAVRIDKFINNTLKGRKNAEERGGGWGYGYHIARLCYTAASTTASSPNGRLKGEELSKNSSASMGQNREGATAAILTSTKIDATTAYDVPIDIGLLPASIKGDDGLMAMYGLLKTFNDRKGHAIHFNVFDSKTLREAQLHPEKYQDLQIRVSGWNVLWNNINKVEQDGFIKQAESLI